MQSNAIARENSQRQGTAMPSRGQSPWRDTLRSSDNLTVGYTGGFFNDDGEMPLW